MPRNENGLGWQSGGIWLSQKIQYNFNLGNTDIEML